MADEARKLTPFRIITRGEDTVDKDNDITFADFSPRVLPADVPEEEYEIPEPAPKDESAQGDASSPESPKKQEPPVSENPVQTTASEEDGQHSPNENSQQISSFDPKSG